MLQEQIESHKFVQSTKSELLLMAEILHHLWWMKPNKQWDELPTSTGAGFLPSTVVLQQSSAALPPLRLSHKSSPVIGDATSVLARSCERNQSKTQGRQ